MGFDNECILNIQSLAGEYFCPVCRLLVYPNEALQSQCTHLYCKPCLTYIVSTTRACPYDGYLVTETDSKPLIESNKPLVDTIGKIAVHCLYHRSGCTWQGPLNDCTSHCSGCSFGDSPVVCNRCGIQIVHRQVQEHAQNCPGVQHQVQKTEGATDPSTASAGATANHDQAVSQAAVVTSQLQTSQSTITTMPSQDPNLQTNSSSQSQSLVQGAGLTAEQWYQQQQQYQQYSQQYPGYDPYQQHYPQYYPYQQAVIPQYQQPNLQAHVPPTTGQHQVYVQPQTQSQPQPQQQVQPQPQPQIQSQLQPQQQAQPQPQLQPHTPHIQNPVDTQLPSPVQINPHQQLHPAVLPHSQIQAHAHPSAHGHPYPQPYSHSQVVSQPLTQEAQVPRYQQSHLQIQHPQPQIHQQIQPLIQPQPQHPAQSQSLSQAQPQGHLQYPPQLNPPQSNQAINVNVQVQAQNPPAHAVGGHQSYSQPQPQGKTGASQQFPAHLQPQAMHLTQSSNPVQVQTQFLQQSMYPPSQAALPSQQHPALLPSSGPIQNTASTQQPIHPHSQQPGHSVNQRPFIQPVQQAMPQQYYQQPLPISSQPPLQGQSHSFMQHIYAHPQPPQNVTQLPGLPNGQSQNVVGRHLMPNHGIHSQSYTQPAVGVQVRPRYHGASQQNILTPNDQGKLHPEQCFGDNIFHKSSAQQEPVVPSEKDAKVIGVVVDGSEIKSVKSETDMKSMDDEHKSMVEDKSKKAESHLFDNGGPKLKPIVKKDQELENSTVQAGVTGGFQQKCLPSQEAELEEQVGELQKGAINISGVGPQAAHASSLSPGQNVASSGSLFGAEGKSSHQCGFQDPMSDQGRQQQLSSHYGPTTLPQWPGTPSLLPTPLDPHQVHGLGYPPTHLRPPGVPVPGQSLHPPEHGRPPGGVPDSGSVASFGRPYSQGNAGTPSFGTPPQGAFGSHGGMMPKATPYGYEGQKNSQHPTNLLNAETFSNQRLNYADSRQPYPNMTSANVAPGFESVSTLESRDERFKSLPDEHPFRQGLDHRFPGRGFENDVKQFLGPPSLDYHVSDSSSKPFDKGHHGSKYNAHERPDRPREDTDRMEPIHGHPDFFGPGPTFARHDMDGLAQRSPSRAHPGIPLGGFGGSSLDAISGRDIRRFGGPLGNSFREGRISMLPTHLHRGKFEGRGGMPLDEHFRNDVIGQDNLPGNLRRGEHLGPPNMPWNLHFDDPVSFGAHPRHVGRAEMAGPRMFEPFGRGNESSHPRFGEPGFRSNFSFHGFPSDDESYTADMEFGNLRKRKAMSNGWCRICKVDCDTIEGLDLHSQTREHQKRTMDMVRSIKRNAKKHKLTSGDLPSPGDANKLKNTISEGRGKKN